MHMRRFQGAPELITASISANSQVGLDPCVIVWDSITCKEIVKLHQG